MNLPQPPSPKIRGRAGRGAELSRRHLATLMATLPVLLAAHPAQATTLESALRRTLPPGLDPRALGTALRAAHPACTTADCLAHAAPPDNLATLPSRSAADFANGHTITVNGWILSHTEAWLCAALAN